MFSKLLHAVANNPGHIEQYVDMFTRESELIRKMLNICQMFNSLVVHMSNLLIDIQQLF